MTKIEAITTLLFEFLNTQGTEIKSYYLNKVSTDDILRMTRINPYKLISGMFTWPNDEWQEISSEWNDLYSLFEEEMLNYAKPPIKIKT